MKSRPFDLVVHDEDGAGELVVSFADDEDFGRAVLFESTPFDGCLVLDPTSLRELARALEHAADWIAEGTRPEDVEA